MKPLEDGLERMLETGKLPDENTPVGAYLKANPSVRRQVEEMMELSRQIRETFAVKANQEEELCPEPGFYARVLARIEAQSASPSIWNFFLEPLGRRLVHASLAFALLLFAALLAAPDADNAGLLAAQPDTTILQVAPLQGAFLASDAPGFSWVEHSPDYDRGAALVELVTYEQ